MQGIEQVGTILERPAAFALFAVVEENGDKGQNGEGLDRDLEGAEQELLSLVAEPVDEDQAQKLRPFPIPEHMEHQHRGHAQNAVVREGHHARQQQKNFSK